AKGAGPSAGGAGDGARVAAAHRIPQHRLSRGRPAAARGAEPRAAHLRRLRRFPATELHPGPAAHQPRGIRRLRGTHDRHPDPGLIHPHESLRNGAAAPFLRPPSLVAALRAIACAMSKIAPGDFCCKHPCNTSEDTMASTLEALERWVGEVAAQTHPAKIHWCDGSEAEYQALLRQMLADGTLIELN